MPSAKARWFGTVRQAGLVGRTVFWPAPNVDSGLVELVAGDHRRARTSNASRSSRVVDAAFAQRRKMLRSALASWAGGSTAAARLLETAGIPATARGEQLDIADFAALAAARHGPFDTAEE